MVSTERRAKAKRNRPNRGTTSTDDKANVLALQLTKASTVRFGITQAKVLLDYRDTSAEPNHGKRTQCLGVGYYQLPKLTMDTFLWECSIHPDLNLRAIVGSTMLSG